MSDFVEVKVTGLDELQRDLNKLAESVSPKELQPILKTEADGFVPKLLPLTPVGPTGNLRRGVQSWNPKINRRHPDAMARAGVKYKIAPHVHFIEYGTKERSTKTGAYRGYSPARPFIMPLADKELPGMLKRIIERIWDLIERNWSGRSGNA